MSKQYVICERSYSYNDEGYDMEDGVTPESVITDKQKAIDICLQKNIDAFRNNADYLSGEMFEWNMRGTDVLTKQQIEQVSYGEGEAVFKKLPPDKILELIKILKDPFYTIFEVDTIE